MEKRAWGRGVVLLLVLIAVGVALVAAPVGAALNKKKVVKIAKKQATQIATDIAAGQAGRFAFDRTDDAGLTGTNGTLAQTTIVAPTNGHLAITAGAESSGDEDSIDCFLEVDGTQLPSSERTVLHLTGDGEANCETEGAAAVTAGSHTVTLEAADVDDASTTFDESVLWVIFVPFDANGNAPAGQSLG